MRLSSLIKKAVREKQDHRFYRYQDCQGNGEPDPAIQVYQSYTEIPPCLRQVVLPAPCLNVMYYRLKQGRARLLCLSEDGRRVQAYGWLQTWHPFRRRFRMVAQEGTMLGPYWTAPEDRGQGLYGRLLRHSLFLCPKDKPVLIYTSPENTASQRGIEKAGFSLLGDYTVTVWLRFFVSWKRGVRS